MDAFAEAVARPVTPSIIEQALEQGFQQRSDVALNLGAYVGKVVHKPGTPAGAGGARLDRAFLPLTYVHTLPKQVHILLCQSLSRR
jgi:hypothetical protein